MWFPTVTDKKRDLIYIIICIMPAIRWNRAAQT